MAERRSAAEQAVCLFKLLLGFAPCVVGHGTQVASLREAVPVTRKVIDGTHECYTMVIATLRFKKAGGMGACARGEWNSG